MTLPWMAAKILLRPVAELRAHAGNARVHGAAQIEQIKASMLAFGFTTPLLVDEEGVLIAGHGRLEAASALGIAKVPVIALRHLSAAQKEALRLADNRIAENATWDQVLLRDALAAVQAAQDIDLGALGFARQEWAKLRERNEALDCAVLARAALWLLGADRYGEHFWARLRDEAADAPLTTAPPVAVPTTASSGAAPADTTRPRSWLAPRGGWLR
ncbi:ParB/Srx family N-terminal domain-containing protein [Falsiroseomonas ponticola]|uniref:ParB/Srx family N-terminal domain-containing protein n=1 Tax=Falsiroseomonas ponticola TaxID=2786951 RepID=UPI001CF7D738|nr:ParB/Srx family N-terminal domain-containing protein [Roseomonas ponticola]